MYTYIYLPSHTVFFCPPTPAVLFSHVCVLMLHTYAQIQHTSTYIQIQKKTLALPACSKSVGLAERWGAGVETQKNVRGEIGGWGRVPFNEPYAPSLSTIYDGA